MNLKRVYATDRQKFLLKILSRVSVDFSIYNCALCIAHCAFAIVHCHIISAMIAFATSAYSGLIATRSREMSRHALNFFSLSP